MNCAEARRLLEGGAQPGSATPERARLGFHLAGCAACRAHQAALRQSLLADLLGQVAPAPAPTPELPATRQPAGSPPSHPPAPGRRLRRVALGGLSIAGLAAAIVAIWVGFSLFRTHRNVQAMIVSTDAATEPPSLLATSAETSRPPAPSAAPPPTAVPPTRTPAPTRAPTPTTPPATATPTTPPAGGPITVLLLGSDRRPGESDPSRTDAIVVARIDPDRHRVALLSLPRDLWVEIPGYGATRINAAHVWGIIYGDPAGGIGLASKTVSNLLGIPIDYTVLIDFESFIGAIDSLGGIDVEVAKELYDPEFPTMDYGYTEARFLPGRQHMDGATALMYSRIRHPDSDFERMRRQQAVLVGILDRLREQNALQAIKSLEDVTSALRGYVQTDMPEERIVGLAWALRDFTPGQVERYLLDEDMISFGIGEDRWAEVAHPGAIDALVMQLLGQ